MDGDMIEEDLRHLLAVRANDAKKSARRNHRDMIALITSLGHSGP